MKACRHEQERQVRCPRPGFELNQVIAEAPSATDKPGGLHPGQIGATPANRFAQTTFYIQPRSSNRVLRAAAIASAVALALASSPFLPLASL
jgi:hypothetical protein